MAVVTKLDAVHRQLTTAIQLWLDDGDYVSVHSLAYAAHQIVHDLNRAKAGPPMLLDSPAVSTALRQKFVALVKLNSNFFKHADGRRKGKNAEPEAVEFDPALNELFILTTIHGLRQIGEKLGEYEVAFQTWAQFNRADLFIPSWREALKDARWVQLSESFRTVEKKKFFDAVLQAQRELTRD